MARRNQHSQEEIKAMVLAAAEAIVIEHGGSALTVRKIAMRIGYTVGSIYMVFDNMADVISHINAQTVEALNCHLQQISPADLSALGHVYLNFAKQNYLRWQLWSETQGDSHCRASPIYRAKVAALIHLLEKQLPDTGNPIQNTQLATTLWASMQGVCVALLTGQADDSGDAENSMDLLTALFLRG
jgi:AcrR family transcriptional regulator